MYFSSPVIKNTTKSFRSKNAVNNGEYFLLSLYNVGILLRFTKELLIAIHILS